MVLPFNITKFSKLIPTCLIYIADSCKIMKKIKNLLIRFHAVNREINNNIRYVRFIDNITYIKFSISFKISTFGIKLKIVEFESYENKESTVGREIFLLFNFFFII